MSEPLVFQQRGQDDPLPVLRSLRPENPRADSTREQNVRREIPQRESAQEDPQDEEEQAPSNLTTKNDENETKNAGCCPDRLQNRLLSWLNQDASLFWWLPGFGGNKFLKWPYANPEEASKAAFDELYEQLDKGEADIYGVASVMLYYGRAERGQPWWHTANQPLLCSKAIISGILQVVLAPLVVGSEMSALVSKNLVDIDGTFEFCQQNEEDLTAKLVAVGFGAYIVLQFITAMTNFNQSPMTYLVYHCNSTNEILGDPYVWGYFVNVTSMCWATIGGFFLIFISGDNVDMILNALALGFLAEMDDALASDKEQAKAKKVLDDVLEKMKADESSKEAVGGASPAADPNPEENLDKMEVTSLSWILRLVQLSNFNLTALAFFAALVGPYFLGICYGTRERE